MVVGEDGDRAMSGYPIGWREGVVSGQCNQHEQTEGVCFDATSHGRALYFVDLR